MTTVSCASAIRLPGVEKQVGIVDILDILPLKVRLAEDGSRVAGSDASSVSDADQLDIDLGLAEEPRLVGPIGLPPGLAPPPGLGLEVADGLECLKSAVAPAKRTPLRRTATLYSPLSSGAEAFVPKSLSLAQGRARGSAAMTRMPPSGPR